jgi:hypothetical protein
MIETIGHSRLFIDENPLYIINSADKDRSKKGKSPNLPEI